MRVIVVGAGFGGLSAAAHLVAAGHDVSVIERSASAGGRAAVADEGGFSLDLGPTVLTMPHLLEDAFAAVGRSLAECLPIDPVAPAYHASFADGSALHVHTDATAMATEIERSGGRPDLPRHVRRRLRVAGARRAGGDDTGDQGVRRRS